MLEGAVRDPTVALPVSWVLEPLHDLPDEFMSPPDFSPTVCPAVADRPGSGRRRRPGPRTAPCDHKRSMEIAKEPS